VAVTLASVFGVGRAPVAPGTAGSLVAALGIWLVPFTRPGLAAAWLLVTAVGLWAGGRAERALGAKDPGVIVIDEVAGMMLSVLLVPPTLPVLATGFVLFRCFDVWKPFPAGASQRLPGGWGVMVDDLVAGAYALLLLLAARRLLGVPA
jgi:phosphatidylglycerophosphatase A